MGLLIKALEITVKRKDFAGDREAVHAWLMAAQAYSVILAEAANDDITGAPERKRVEIPMNAARSAGAGLDLCAEAAGLARGALAADVAVAAALLCAAVRAILLCVDSNVGASEAEERRELERHALAQQERILGACPSKPQRS
jgi:hypothetical protein